SEVIGLHAEGPFLAPDFKGAHAAEVLTAPTPEAVEAILAATDGTLAQITIAAELPGALDAIARLTSAGVRVALGHTAADYDQAAAAFDAGASILTHAFNAMPGIHHRAPGPILAAREAEHVTVELINDGVHVVAPAARMLRELVPGRIALSTDAMAATGMSDGDYMLGSLPVRAEDSVARLATAAGAGGGQARRDRGGTESERRRAGGRSRASPGARPDGRSGGGADGRVCGSFGDRACGAFGGRACPRERWARRTPGPGHAGRPPPARSRYEHSPDLVQPLTTRCEHGPASSALAGHGTIGVWMPCSSSTPTTPATPMMTPWRPSVRSSPGLAPWAACSSSPRRRRASRTPRTRS